MLNFSQSLPNTHQAEKGNEYGQPESHTNVIKNQESEGNCVESVNLQAISFQSRSNPKVKVTLEFTGAVEGTAMEEEITGVLGEKYLEKVLSGAIQEEATALLCTTRNEEENTNE